MMLSLEKQKAIKFQKLQEDNKVMLFNINTFAICLEVGSDPPITKGINGEMGQPKTIKRVGAFQ